MIPRQEINSKERDKFWEKEEQEEKKRQEEERRRKEEERTKLENERKQREVCLIVIKTVLDLVELYYTVYIYLVLFVYSDLSSCILLL